MNTLKQLRLAALGVLSALLVVPLLVVTPPLARAEELSKTGQRAFQQISSCVADKNVLLASIVVDQSGSLKYSDPKAKRVDAVTAIIDALAELKRSGGDNVTVEANLALFGEGYDELVPWGSVTDAHGVELLDKARTGLSNSAGLTDYREALSGAQDSINARTRALGPTKPCSVILWFTDGRLDVFKDGQDAHDKAARKEICKRNGIADSIRAGGTHIIALALFSNDPSIPKRDRVTKTEQEQLRSIAEGKASVKPCGTTPIPEDFAAGAYLRATDAASLRRLFAGVGALIQGDTEGNGGKPIENKSGTIEFDIDRAISGFRLVFETEDHGDVTLISPGGDTLDLKAGNRSIPGGSVKSSGRDGLYVTTVTADTAPIEGKSPIEGKWQFHAKTSTVKLLDLYYSWGTTLKIHAPEGLVPGKRNEVVITPQKNGVTDKAEWYSSFTPSVTVDGKAVEARQKGDIFTVPVDLSAGDAREAVTVGATARARTREHGIELGPISSSVELPVGIPTIDSATGSATLDFGIFTHLETPTRTLTLKGAPQGESMVCLPAVSTWDHAPQGVPLTLTNDIGSEDKCVKLAAGETQTVTFTLHASERGEGLIKGVIPATLKRDANTKAKQDIPVTAQLTLPVNEWQRWLLTGLFTWGALMLAWLVAWVARNLTDRYRLGRSLSTASIGVRVTPSGIQRSDLGAGPGERVVTTDDFEPFAARDEKRKTFSARGIDFTRRGPWWWPWTPYRAVAATTGSPLVAVQGGSATSGPALKGVRGAPASFAPTQHAYLAAASAPEDPDGPIDARLVILANPDASGSLRHRVDQWNTALRSASIGGIDWAAVHAALRDSLAGPAATDQGSTPPPPPAGPNDPPAGPAGPGGPGSPTDTPPAPAPDFFSGADPITPRMPTLTPSTSGRTRRTGRAGGRPVSAPKTHGRPKPPAAPVTEPRQPDLAAPPDYF